MALAVHKAIRAWSVPLHILLLLPRLIPAKVYQRCELARELRDVHGIPADQLPTWICIAHHESHFDTAARNKGSGDHGIFQISEMYWCMAPGKRLNACGMPCSAFEDDEIEDDVVCARRIYDEHRRLSGDGFNAWAAYGYYCKHSPRLPLFVAGCFDEENLVSYGQEWPGELNSVADATSRPERYSTSVYDNPSLRFLSIAAYAHQKLSYPFVPLPSFSERSDAFGKIEENEVKSQGERVYARPGGYSSVPQPQAGYFRGEYQPSAMQYPAVYNNWKYSTLNPGFAESSPVLFKEAVPITLAPAVHTPGRNSTAERDRRNRKPPFLVKPEGIPSVPVLASASTYDKIHGYLQNHHKTKLKFTTRTTGAVEASSTTTGTTTTTTTTSTTTTQEPSPSTTTVSSTTTEKSSTSTTTKPATIVPPSTTASASSTATTSISSSTTTEISPSTSTKSTIDSVTHGLTTKKPFPLKTKIRTKRPHVGHVHYHHYIHHSRPSSSEERSSFSSGISKEKESVSLTAVGEPVKSATTKNSRPERHSRTFAVEPGTVFADINENGYRFSLRSNGFSFSAT